MPRRYASTINPSETIETINKIDEYFNYQLEQGLTVPEIIETLNSPVLPSELKKTGFTEPQIRRAAQLVSTRRIIAYNLKMQSEI
jgi:hypothetical protein